MIDPAPLTPDDLARIEQREKSALRRVWKAMGCAWNPDDFKPTVRDRMWDQVVEIAQKDLAKNNRLYLENAELVAGVRSRDERIAALEAVIGEAPHADYCSTNVAWGKSGAACDCWKSFYRAGADQ